MVDETDKATRHQTAPEELQVSEIRYRRLFESARDGILILDAASRRITDANPFMVELMSFSRDEFLGKELWEIGLFKDKDDSQIAFQELEATGYIRYEDMPLQTKAGKLWHVEFISNVYRENGHQVIQCNIRDITERKRAEERLRQGEQWQRTIFEASHEGILVEDDEKIHYVNKSYLRMFGYDDAEELIGRHISTVVSPEDAERLLKFGRGRLRGEHPPSEYEFRGRRKDGSTIDVEASVSASNVGDSVYITTMIRDITGRKAAKESIRFQAHLLDTVEQSVIATNTDGIVIYWNQFAHKLYGWTAQEALGRHIMELTTPEIMTEQALEIMSRLRRGESWAGEFNVRRRDGTTFLVQIINSPIKDDKGNLIGIVGVSVDITERKRQEDSLRELTRQLERQSNVFNTTLSSITDFAYIFDRDGRFIYANQPLLDLWGLKLEEAVGKNFFELQYPDDLALRLQQQIQQVFDTGQPLRDETPYTSPTGAEGFYEYIFTPVKGSEGAVEVVAGSTRDYTERKRAEELLRASEAQLRTLFDEAPVGVYLVDADFRIRAVNPTALPVFGDIPDLIGRDFDEVIHVLWEQEYADELVRRFRRTLETGEPYFALERIEERRDRGVTEYYEWQINRIPLPEGDYGVVCYFRDVSASVSARQKIAESEEKYRTLFESIDEGFCIIEVLFDGDEKPIDYRFLEVSPSFERQTGIANAAGRRMREIAPLHEEYWFEIYGRVALTGEPVRFENRAEQLHRWYDVYAFRVGEPGLGRVGVLFHDITGRKQAEEALKGLNERLEQRVAERTVELTETNASLQAEIAERLRAELGRSQVLRRLVMAQEDERRRIAREMHDQFGQQLTVLMLKLGLLKEDCGGRKELCEQVETLEVVARQLDADVDFLVWELRPTALDDLGLQDALTSYAQNWSKHIGVSVEVDARGVGKGRLTSETETVLYRIAQEALNNVAKHASAANVSVLLEGRADIISLIVEDDGVGFDDEPGPGASDKGLGLVGMRERAALVGGTAEVESQPGEGTRVIVRIPAPPRAQEGEAHE